MLSYGRVVLLKHNHIMYILQNIMIGEKQNQIKNIFFAVGFNKY